MGTKGAGSEVTVCQDEPETQTTATLTPSTSTPTTSITTADSTTARDVNSLLSGHLRGRVESDMHGSCIASSLFFMRLYAKYHILYRPGRHHRKLIGNKGDLL